MGKSSLQKSINSKKEKVAAEAQIVSLTLDLSKKVPAEILDY